MPKTKSVLNKVEMGKLLLLGATARFEMLVDEERRLIRQFPALRVHIAAKMLNDSGVKPLPVTLRAPEKKKRTMSAKARKAIGAAQRKRWAEKRKAAKKE